MSEGDIFREVEQDMRREQLAQLWRKYGVYVIGIALAVVLGVGGYQSYTWWQATRAASDGAAFVEAGSLQRNGQLDAASERFSALAQGGAGSYPALSRLRVAAIAAANGDTEAAVHAYDRVVESTDEPILRGFAQIQAATLLIDSASPSEIENRIGGLRGDSSPWRHSARELIALSLFKANRNDKAQTLYQELLSDGDTPGPMRQRAQMMLSLIDAPADGKTTDAASAVGE